MELTDRQYMILYWLALAETPLIVAATVACWPIGLALITAWGLTGRSAGRV